MAMVVKNNMSAVRTLNTLNANSSALQKSLNRVSSGMKINSAQDDAAGYAISERMRVRIRSLDQANQNTQNDSSLMKTAEGAVGNTVEILRALKEKAINAANDSNTDEDRQTIQKELNQFIDQIDDNALVQFNGKYLVDGSKNNAATSTKTILLNQSLSKDNYAGDALTGLKNRAGDSLGIQTTDKWQVSWVQNGVVSSTSGDVGSKTLEGILSEAKIPGTVARTDDEGLVGTSEAKTSAMGDYTPASTTLSSSNTYTDLSLTDVGQLFTADGLESIISNMTAPTATGTSATLTGYFMEGTDADGNSVDEAVTVEITCTDASTGLEKYDVSFKDSSGNAVDLTAGDVQLYYKETPDKTLVDEDGNAMADQTGYVNMPASTVTLTNLTGTDLNPTNSSQGTEITNIVTSIGLTAGANASADAATLAGKSLGDFGIYKATTDTDGNITSYEKADDVSFTYDSTANKFNVVGTLAGTYYTFDDTQSEVVDKFTLTNFSGTDTAVKDIPDEITVEVYNDSPAVNDPCDKAKKDVYTPDKTAGIAFVAGKAGVADQISGLTINIMDQDGNVKKAANAALDQFKQYQRAENETGDMSLNFHIGSEANVAIKVGLTDMRSEALGLKGSDGTRIDVYTKEHANAAINVIENALTKALDQQTTIGAIEARLEYTSTNLTTSSENVQAAESTIRDADMAKEMTNYTKSNVLLQAAQAMLAQANQNSSAVLSLLQ